jgi:RNA polymerase sigma factor (sigma-70 family)
MCTSIREVWPVSEAVDEATAGAPSDAALIRAVRTGDSAAYGVLYERHLAAARRGAAALASTAAEREDLVAEAFTRVLRVLRAGHGPDEAFRAYLLVTMRNALITDVRRSPDISLFAEVPDARPAGGGDDPILARLEASVAAEAFATLPERWRTVLWHTEVEGESPADIAPLLGLAPNSVSALAYRAREGLRQAYLSQHLPTMARPSCRAIATQLSTWVRRGCPRHSMRRITRHLDRCAECTRLAGGLVKVNAELRGVLAPVLLGTPLALAYLSGSAGGSAAGAAIAGVASVPWLATVKSVVVGVAVVAATGAAAVASDTPADPAPQVGVPAGPAPAPPVPRAAVPPVSARVPTQVPAAVPVPAPVADAATQPAVTATPAAESGNGADKTKPQKTKKPKPAKESKEPKEKVQKADKPGKSK